MAQPHGTELPSRESAAHPGARRWKKRLLWGLGGFLALLLVGGVVLLLLVRQSMAPTRGVRIGAYAQPRTALLVVDIQEDYTGPAARKPYRDGERIIAAANALLEQARQNGEVAVYIENIVTNPIQSWMMGGINAPDAPGTRIDRRVLRIPGGRTFTKDRSDAFSNPALERFLRERQIDRLRIVGLDAAYCVNATARGALNRGYRVVLHREGIATESGRSLDELAAQWREAGAEIDTGLEPQL